MSHNAVPTRYGHPCFTQRWPFLILRAYGSSPAILPGVSPCAVAEGGTDSVIGDSLPIVSGQQVAPGAVTVGIEDGINGRSQVTGSVHILAATSNIACMVMA